LARLDARDDVTLDGETYRDLLHELGYDAAELARVEATIEDDIVRGRGFLVHGRFDDAIDELVQANTLAPWRVDAHLLLAEAYVGRWQAEGRPVDSIQGRTHARAVLERDPEANRAFELLNILDRKGNDMASPKEASGDSPRRLGGRIGAVVVVVGVGMGALGWLGLLPASGIDGAYVDPHIAGDADVPQSKTLPEGTHTLPVEWVVESEVEGAVADFTGSRIERKYERGVTQIRLRLTNQADQRITELGGRLEYLDPKGTVLSSKEIALINSAYAPLHQGDEAVWGTGNDYGPWDTAMARFVVTKVQRQAGAGPPPKAKPMCVKWDVDKPPAMDLAVSLRLKKERMFFGPAYDVAVKNTGKAEIRNLRVLLHHEDAKGQRITDSTYMPEELVSASWYPVFRAGDTRFVHYASQIDKDDRERIARVCVHVVSIE